MTERTASLAAAPRTELDNLIDDLAARIQAGKAVDIEALAGEYPEHASELRRVLPAMLVLAGLPSSGGETKADGPLGELGDFQLIREVGRGGMGIVYEAEQRSLRRLVALKVLPWVAAMDPKQLQRFKNEALAAASLKHDHIVSVYAVGCERGVHYYAMEFVEGQTLAEVIDRRAGSCKPPENSQTSASLTNPQGAHATSLADTGPVAALSTKVSRPDRAWYRRAAELIADGADALEHAHSLGIVHRDIKPGNLLVDENGRIYVSDFGLARFGPDAGLTMSGDLLGTLRYMAPEQALARHGLADHRVDVYGLGATLYELLTGKPAVGGTEKPDVLRRLAFEEPTPLRKIDKAIPAELETIALKCLSKNPAERYPTAGELAADLRRFVDDQAIKAKPPTVWQLAARRLRRHPKALGAAFAVALIAAIGAAASAVLIDREQRRTEAAYAEVRDAYAQARAALDDMSSGVIDEWLSKQPELTADHRKFLERALAQYERFAARPSGDEESRAGVAFAYGRVGSLRSKLGDRAAAVEAYRRCGELFERLMTENPRPAYRKALAQNRYALGSHWTGEYALAAEDLLARAAAEYEALAAEDPQDQALRRSAADAYGNLGLVRRNMLFLGAAEKAARKAVMIAESLPADDSGGIRSNRYVRAVQLCMLCEFLVVAGGLEEAEAIYVGLLPLWNDLLARFPTERLYRCWLRLAYSELSCIRFSIGRPELALDDARRALEIARGLADDYPAVFQHRFDYSHDLENRGTQLAAAGQFSEAEDCLRKCLAFRNTLSSANEQHMSLRIQLCAVLRRAGKLSDAEQCLRTALESQSRGVASPAADTAAAESLRLARGYRELGAVLNARGATAEGERCLSESMARLRRLVGQNPVARDYRSDLADVYTDLSAMLSSTSRGAEAAELERAARALRSTLDDEKRAADRGIEEAKWATDREPKNPDHWRRLGLAHYHAADWCAAIKATERSLELRGGADGADWLLLAMVQWQAGHPGIARWFHGRAVAWLEQHSAGDAALLRLRAEAEGLLGIAAPATAVMAPSKP
jgi:serine/threonine protein kinase